MEKSPYDNIYVFHDAENCLLSSKEEARLSNGQLVKLANGHIKFHQEPVLGNIQGAYVFKEIIRTGLACKIGVERAHSLMGRFAGLNIKYTYHLCMSPRLRQTAYYPSESTIKDFVDTVGRANFHIDPAITDHKNTDEILKDLWREQVSTCKTNFSLEAIERTLFILISGDRDFIQIIRDAYRIGVDVCVIYSTDSPVRDAVKENLAERHWAVGTWLNIITEARSRDLMVPPPPPQQPLPLALPIPGRTPSRPQIRPAVETQGTAFFIK